MFPTQPLKEMAPGLFQWSVFDTDRQLDFNGVFITSPGSNVVIDPPELSALQMEDIWSRGGVAFVILTNRHHSRKTADLVQRTRAKILVPQADAEGMPVKADRTYLPGETLPAGLLAIGVPDSKSPGETALLLPRDGGTLILGDALIGKPAGSLSLLPDAKFADAAAARRGIAALLPHDYVRVLVGDGANPERGREAILAVTGKSAVP